MQDLFCVKILTKDTPSIRVKYKDQIDDIDTYLQGNILSKVGKRKRIVRKWMIDFIRNNSVLPVPDSKYVIPGTIEIILMYFVITKVASNNTEKNIDDLISLIDCFFGSLFVNKTALKQDLQSIRKNTLIFKNKKWFKISMMNLKLNRRINKKLETLKILKSFKFQYSSLRNRFPSVGAVPNSLTVSFCGGCRNSHTMLSELVPFLTRMNSAVLDPFEISDEKFLNCHKGPYINLFKDISYSNVENEVLLDWNISWSQKIVELDGINHYQGFYERLSTYFRRYEIKLENIEEKRLFELELIRADRFLRVYKSILDISKKYSINFSIFTSNSHVVPYSCIRDVSSAAGVDLFLIGPAYSRLKTEKFSNSTINFKISKYKDRYSKRAPFLVSEQDVQDWLADTDVNHKRCIEQTRDAMDERLSQQKNIDVTSFSNYAHWRKNYPEGRVFMCLGKVSVDLAYPVDGGKLFSDYKSFVMGIENFAINTPDVFIFFRPHPHEESPEIALSLVEKMEDWLSLQGKNCALAPPSKYPFKDVISLTDAVLLYNGSAILEYTSAKIPVFAFCDQAAIDYPIGLKEVSRLQELKTTDLIVSDNESEKALLFLTCMFFDNQVVEIQNGYLAAHNMSINVPQINTMNNADDLSVRNDKIIRSQIAS